MRRGLAALALAMVILAAAGCADYRAAAQAERLLQEAQQALAGGQRARGRALAVRAGRLRPSSPLVQARVGMQLFASGTPRAALPYLERALASDSPLVAPARLAAIESYRFTGQEEKAGATLLGALRVNGDDPRVLNDLGYRYADQGRYLPQARRLLERAVALAPRDGAVVDSLGWALVKSGEVSRGYALLRRADRLTPDNPEIVYHLATAALLSGDREEARAQLSRALALDPEYQQALRLRERLGP